MTSRLVRRQCHPHTQRTIPIAALNPVASSVGVYLSWMTPPVPPEMLCLMTAR